MGASCGCGDDVSRDDTAKTTIAAAEGKNAAATEDQRAASTAVAATGNTNDTKTPTNDTKSGAGTTTKDTNDTGSANEVIQAAVKAAAETPESIFDQVDKDADGKLTEKEFAIWAEHNQEKAGIFFSFLDENDFQGGGGVSFKDKVGVFWLKAVMEFDDNVDMKLDKAEFCTLYNKLARAKEADVEPIQRS